LDWGLWIPHFSYGLLLTPGRGSFSEGNATDVAAVTDVAPTPTAAIWPTLATSLSFHTLLKWLTEHNNGCGGGRGFLWGIGGGGGSWWAEVG